jgi:hypothetical protein
MKRIAVILFLVFLVLHCSAQKDIDALVQAEKNFAAYSVSHSTKEAFLAFIDSSSIMFEAGKPVKAVDFWSKREKRSSVLNWHPQYAEVSASGDFGYTTGPWTFQPSATDTIVARGQYATVWYLTKNNEWKFLVDLGVDNTPVNNTADVALINAAKESDKKNTTHVYSMVMAENRFLQVFAKNRSKAYKKYLSNESILNRNGFAAAVTGADQRVIIDSTPSFTKHIMDSWGVSPARDLGYTYGTTVANGKTENYFRVWRREKTGWKIAMEVLRY